MRVPGRHALLRDDAVPGAALVLAAGGGSRFGEAPKLIADLEGRPVLEHVVAAAYPVKALERIVVVLGAHAEEVFRHVDFEDAEVVLCRDWASGQAASLKRGLEALEGTEKVLVLLGDQPLVTTAAIERMANEPAGSRAAYDGRPGHPVVLGGELIARAMQLEGDQGLRDEQWRLVPCEDVAGGRDIDTPEDLEAIRNEARAVLRR